MIYANHEIMNALVSFCHFCELHGPKIVFTTQAYRNLPSKASDELDYETLTQEDQWKYGRLDRETIASLPTPETCSACSCSFPQNCTKIFTNDDTAQVTYVSSQFPLHPEIFTLAKQACIRSLSCEVCSEREGPIYFGDQVRGQVLSYTFFLKDLQARGGKRWYSILIFMQDKMFLMNSWNFFVNHIKGSIHMLQEGSDQVYIEEEEKARLKRQSSPMIAGKTKKSKASGNPRPLVELVGDEKIWVDLHTRFITMLKEGGMRLQEEFVHGKPFTTYDVTQADRELIINFCNFFGLSNFDLLLHHLLTGHTIIIICEDLKVISKIVCALKCIVPYYLIRPAMTEGGVSKDQFKANILLTQTSNYEAGYYENDYILELIWKEETCGHLPVFDETGQICFNKFCYKIKSNKLANVRPPQLIPEICKVINNMELSLSTVSLYVATLLDSWTNKAHIWGELTHEKNLLPSTEGKVGPTADLSAHLPKAELLSVGALECDVPLLNFWSTFYQTE